ncbi:MAG: bifunctional glutamine synthetase adenylyltransferase/deadenyltransferase, partial [Gammaproteobacteria bacterium]
MHESSLPSPLRDNWLHRHEQFCSRANQEQADWLDKALQDKQFAHAIGLAWGGSEFIANTSIQQPAMFQELVISGDLDSSLAPGDLKQRLRSRLADVTSEDELLKLLRMFRNREMVRIIWRDFTRMAVLEETTGDMTSLAEAILDATLDFLYTRACEEWGTPVDHQGNPQHMVILGMGKLGAWELNVSSDIDLIFTYPEAGETSGGKRSLSNQEFFVRLGQRLIKALDARTADGFVFRVDMRLRPYGQSGALVLNFDA